MPKNISINQREVIKFRGTEIALYWWLKYSRIESFIPLALPRDEMNAIHVEAGGGAIIGGQDQHSLWTSPK
jgi:hypothetical protein